MMIKLHKLSNKFNTIVDCIIAIYTNYGFGSKRIILFHNIFKANLKETQSTLIICTQYYIAVYCLPYLF